MIYFFKWTQLRVNVTTTITTIIFIIIIIIPSPGARKNQFSWVIYPPHRWRAHSSLLLDIHFNCQWLRTWWGHKSLWTDATYSGDSGICKSICQFLKLKERTLTFTKLTGGLAWSVRWCMQKPSECLLKAKESNCYLLCSTHGFKLGLISSFTKCSIICSNVISSPQHCHLITPSPSIHES